MTGLRSANSNGKQIVLFVSKENMSCYILKLLS
jgi:hypothetical protein